MFGFLTAPCSGCNSREHSEYRAHFCGLCNRLRQDYGLPMRFLVNRDATFLSLLGNAMNPASKPPVTATCCNPLGKPRLVVQEGYAVSYAAAITLCGLHAKLDDEILDQTSRPTRAALKGARGVLNGPVTRAGGYLESVGFPVETVRQTLGSQALLEKEAESRGRADLSQLSEPSSFTFGKIVAHTAQHQREALEHIGQSLGRLIYILDAWVDRQRDLETRQFNPFLINPNLMNSVPARIDTEINTLATAMRTLRLSSHREVLEVILGRNLQRTCTLLLEDNPSNDQASKHDRRKKTGEPSYVDCSDWRLWCDPCDFIYCCDCTDIGSLDCCGDCGDCGCDCGGDCC